MEWEQLKSEIETVVGKRLDQLQTNLEFQHSRLVDTISKVQSFAVLLRQKVPSEIDKPIPEVVPLLSRAQTARTHHKTELIKTAPIDIKKLGLKKPGSEDRKKEEVKGKTEDSKSKLEEAKKKKAEEGKKKKEEEEAKKREVMAKKKEEEERKKEDAKKKVEEAKEKKRLEDLEKKARAEEVKKKAEEEKERKKQEETEKKKNEEIEKKKKLEEAKKKQDEEKEKKKQEDLDKKAKAEEEKKLKSSKKPEEVKKKLPEPKKKEESKTKIGASATPKNASSVDSKKESSTIPSPKPEESLCTDHSSEIKLETPPSELKTTEPPKTELVSSEPEKPEVEEDKSAKNSNHSLPSLEEIQLQIKSIKNTYPEEEILSEKPFELSVGAKSALSLLTTMDEDKFYLDRVPKEEVIWTFRLFFVLLNKNLPLPDTEAWAECQAFLQEARDKEKNHKTIDKYIIEVISNFNFADENIDRIEQMVYGKDNLLQPQYYTEFCALTGLLMFAVREAAIFGGAIKGKVPIWRQYKRLLHKQQQLENHLLS